MSTLLNDATIEQMDALFDAVDATTSVFNAALVAEIGTLRALSLAHISAGERRAYMLTRVRECIERASATQTAALARIAGEHGIALTPDELASLSGTAAQGADERASEIVARLSAALDVAERQLAPVPSLD